MADQAQTDRHHGGPEHATCQGMQDRARQYDWENRQRCVGKSADADGDDGDTGDETLRACRIDQRAARHLAEQCDQPGRRKHKADIELRPVLRGEIDGDERAEAGLHIGNKENEPV
jgi:hypothetical protein